MTLHMDFQSKLVNRCRMCVMSEYSSIGHESFGAGMALQRFVKSMMKME